MKLKNLKNKMIVALAVLLCAMLSLSAALLIPKSKTAKALRGSDWTEIDEIYNGNGVFDSQNLTLLFKALTGEQNATYETVKNKLNNAPVDVNNVHYLTSNDFRTNQYNNGKNVSVWFGGIKWDVTYITNDKSGNIILDLWQSADGVNTIVSGQSTPASTTYLKTCQFQTHANVTRPTYPAYPGHMYSVSLIRSDPTNGLNAGGYVSVDQTTLNNTPKTQSTSNLYAKFTMENPGAGVESLTKYIVKPTDVQYQSNEYSQGDVAGGGSGSDVNSAYNAPNDAYISPDKGKFCDDPKYGFFDPLVKDKYGDWQNDYVWLPSMTETGRNSGKSTICGIWKADTYLRGGIASDSANIWLRSGMLDEATQTRSLRADGDGQDRSVTDELTVRPALHFNLTSAYNPLSVPGTVNIDYDGTAKTLSNISPIPAWYSADVYADSPNSGKKPVTVTYPSGENDMIDANADGYEITAAILDAEKTKYRWVNSSNPDTDTTRTFKYIINPKPIEVVIQEGANGAAPTVSIKNYDTAIVQRDKDNDEEKNTIPVIELVYTGERLGGGSETDFKKLLPGSYTATARIKSGTGANYTLKQTYSKTFTIDTIEVEVKEENIVWQYKNGTGSLQPFNVEDGRRAVQYNSKAYTLSIVEDNLPENIKIDTNKGTNGYLNNVQTNYQSGAYTTTVYLKSDDADYKPSTNTITVSWYIDKSLYDLSTVKWDYTESFTYDLTSHSVTLVIPDDLAAEGLSFTFAQSGSVNSATNAGTYTVKISLSGSNNYIAPEKGNAETYIYNGDGEGFPWELEWVIEKATVDFGWVSGLDGTKTTGKDGKTFYLPEVEDPDNMVTVKHYKAEDFDTDIGKPKENAQPVLPSEMFVAESAEQTAQGTYYAVLEFTGTYGDNYKFGTGAYKEFNTYDQRSSLTVTINKTEYAYDGNAHGVYGTDVKVTGAQQSVISTYVEYEYFSVADGGAETSLGTNAPINAGAYKIKVSVSVEGGSKLVINGESEFEYTIETLVLDVPAVEDGLPYTGQARNLTTLFSLPEGWENYLEVSITCKINGALIPEVNELKIAADYTVNFRIKSGINDGDKNNVEWNVDTGKTKSQDVSVKIGKLILHATEWQDDKYDSHLIFDESNAKNFIVYTVKNEADEAVDRDTVRDSVGVTFYVEVTVGAEHEGSVEIDFAEGITSRHEFFTDGGMPPELVKLPTIALLTFNGTSQTFEIDYGEYKDYIEIDTTRSDLLTQINAGEYKVYFRIKNGQNAVWESTGERTAVEVKFKIEPLVLQDPEVKQGAKFNYTGAAQSPTLNIDATVLAFLDVSGDFSATNADDYTFTLSIKASYAGNVVWESSLGGEEVPKEVKWTIDKAKLPVKWTNGKVPELDLPGEFNGIEVEYTFTDEDGNEVSRDELENGKKYTVTAKLKGGSAVNFEFVDDIGTTLETPTTTDWGFEFNNTPQSSFPWWIFIIVAAVILVIIVVVVIVVVKKRKAATAGDDYYDDNYEYDDGDENDSGDSEDYDDGEEYDDSGDEDEDIIIEDDE